MGTTDNERKLFFNLAEIKNEISAGDELRPNEVALIAQRLGVREEEVVEMNHRLAAGDVPLDTRTRNDAGRNDDGDGSDEGDEPAFGLNPETQLLMHEVSADRRMVLDKALSVLNERERRIFEARQLVDDPITLAELAAELGISSSRVRQIEMRAYEKVKPVMDGHESLLRGGDLVQVWNNGGRRIAARTWDDNESTVFTRQDSQKVALHRLMCDQSRPPSAALKRKCEQKRLRAEAEALFRARGASEGPRGNGKFEDRGNGKLERTPRAGGFQRNPARRAAPCAEDEHRRPDHD
jgi:RNA polymerase sigma factor (sigma-70 family)